MLYFRAGDIVVFPEHLLNEGMNMYKIKYLKGGCGWQTFWEFPGTHSLTLPTSSPPRLLSGDPCAHSEGLLMGTTDEKGETGYICEQLP